MRVLLLGGLGLQGTAALVDLCRSPAVERVVCADLITELPESILRHVERDKIDLVTLDAGKPGAIESLMAGDVDVAIDLLPLPLMKKAFDAALETGVSLVSTNYAHHLQHLDRQARERGIAILPECGLDPGIDLVICGEAVKHFDAVHRLDSYCGGFPERAACDNPLNYKISWNWEGVLGSQNRDSVFIRDGERVAVPAAEQHRSSFTHDIVFDGLGTLEAVPNGNAVFYTDLLGLSGGIRDTGRYSLRWPGWCALWDALKTLGLLSEETLALEGCPVNPRKFLAALTSPRLQYGADEKDIVAMKNVFSGIRDGEPLSMVYDLYIERDLQTGLFAMAMGVGFPVSIAAQMIGAGQIAQRGLLSPVRDIPYGPFMEALAVRGISASVHRAEGSAGTAASHLAVKTKVTPGEEPPPSTTAEV